MPVPRVIKTLSVRFYDKKEGTCYFCKGDIDLTKYTTVVRRKVGNLPAHHGHNIKWKRLGYACSKCAQDQVCNILSR